MSEEEDIPEILGRARTQSLLSESEVAEAEKIVKGSDAVKVPDALLQEKGQMSDDEVVDIRAQISKMEIPQKIKLAMFGGSVVRGLLIFDANKIIQEFVLKNPRLTLQEVEAFAKSTTVSDHILRIISGSKQWMRHYPIKVNLVCNSKTPGDIGLKWLRHLNETDLKRIARSKSIPQLIAVTARKMVTDMERRR